MEFYHSLRSLPLLVYCPNGLIKAVETFLTHRHNTFNTIFGHPKEGRISKLDSGGLKLIKVCIQWLKKLCPNGLFYFTFSFKDLFTYFM